MADDNVDMQAVEQEARGMGWLPKEEFKGKEENWVDAEVFVEKGRQILPIVQANNKRLEQTVQQLSSKLSAAERATQAANAAIEALQEAQAEDVKEQVAAATKELQTQIAAASRDGDHEQVAELTGKLVDLKTADQKADDKDDDKGGDKGDAPQIPQHLVDEITTWYKENEAFLEDSRTRRMARLIGEELLAAGETKRGKAFLDIVKAEVEKTLGGSSRGSGKVNGGNGGTGRSNDGGGDGGAKTFNDLPKEAKDAAARMTSRMVGPDRKYKTQADWYKGYTKSYFAQEQK